MALMPATDPPPAGPGAATAAPATAGAWRNALAALALLVLAIVLLHRETALAMVQIWSRSDTFAHAFLVPPISLWLVWRLRAQLAPLSPRPAPWVLAPMALIALGWLLGQLSATNAATQLTLTALVVLSVPAVLGLQVARRILFPLAFLFFSVPIGEFLLPTLIGWTADFTVAAVRLSGVPVYREGNQFVIPSGRWSVVEACSGVRYLIASFMVGSLFAYLNYRSPRRRWIFAGVSILVPIVANWLRAYMIVMLGHLSGNTIAVGVDHLIYGWVFFGVVIMALFMIGARWAEPDAAPSAAAVLAPASASTPAAGAAPLRVWLLALAAALLAALPVAAWQWLERAQPAQPVKLVLPESLSPAWTASSAPALLTPVHVGPAATLVRSYQEGAAVVTVHLAYYGRQTEASKLVSSKNTLVQPKDDPWNPLATMPQQADAPQGPLTVRATRLLRDKQPGEGEQKRVLAWQLYWVDGRWLASDARAKLAGVWGRLRGSEASASVLIYTEEPAGGDATAVLNGFVRANLRTLEQQLAAARDGR